MLRVGTKDEICGQPDATRRACSSKCPSCSPGWSYRGVRCHPQRAHALVTTLRRRSLRFSMCPLLYPKENHGHARRRESSQLLRGDPLHVCSGLCCSFVICILTVLSDASTTRLARAEDVKKPPKTTGKGECSPPLATHRPSNPMDK